MQIGLIVLPGGAVCNPLAEDVEGQTMSSEMGKGSFSGLM